MILEITRPFHDVILGHHHLPLDVVIVPDQLGATWIAIKVAHAAPLIPASLQPEVTAEIADAVATALAAKV